ncbi:hypothetical protein DM02DRAFT_399313 [Periconia macrospinosa]|uniref:Uncharacterized protein n=1 Tax=Periconia macrospinosa TaxID=97972 RepID=A0A2V1DQM8_9PLEO|nr:hypothetical protein DM02DRAFT_399313 [Periconia macrospinosa]
MYVGSVNLFVWRRWLCGPKLPACFSFIVLCRSHRQVEVCQMWILSNTRPPGSSQAEDLTDATTTCIVGIVIELISQAIGSSITLSTALAIRRKMLVSKESPQSRCSM